MHFSFIRCGILLLFILTQKLTIASTENVSHHGHMTPAKVFTNLLKVPWINLNSSWEDEVTSTCRDDITTLYESADAGELWALQMLDASSKIPSGIITGNIRDLGMYEECIRVQRNRNLANIQGRHCMVSLSMPPKFVENAAEVLHVQKLSAYNPTANVALNFASSVCLPSSCGVKDLKGLVTASIQGTPELVEFEIEVAQVTCSSIGDMSDDFTLGTILAISFFAVVLVFLGLCTVCGFVVTARSGNAPLGLKTLAKFSLCTNAIKLLSTETHSGTMPAIHGMKFLSIFSVVIIHRALSTMAKPLVNLSNIWELRDTSWGPVMLVLPYTVDTFFVISGFLTAYLFLTRLRSGEKINIAKLYLHRYLRLAPSLAALILFDIFILPRLGSGPIWEIILGVTSDFCRENWWTNLLYINNFVNQEKMCLPHTWYLAVEMQLSWLCPIILYPLFHRPKLGLVMLGILLVASLITPAVYLAVNQYAFLYNAEKIVAEQFLEFIYSYTNTFNRALPYFVGILLGYYAVNNMKKITKVQVAVNWILACIFIIFCLWNTNFIQPNAIVYNVAWEASYVSVGRLGWSLAVAWILYACTYGYGGPVERFLSLPIFVPLSRLSYSIYLVSAVIQVGTNAAQKTAEFLSPFSVAYLLWGDLVTSIAVALVLSLCFETPVLVLEKILNVKRPSERGPRSSTEKKERLLAIIKKYPTNGQFGSNSTIQAGTLQPDFWRTVSEVLNTSGVKPTKTPIEWAKIWQDWKSDLLRNDCQLKTDSNDIIIESGQFENGTSAFEKELLIFLTAVICNLNNVASFKESKIAKLARSQLSSCVSSIYLPASMENMSKFSGSTSVGREYPT